jgi:hypothetical protein
MQFNITRATLRALAKLVQAFDQHRFRRSHAHRFHRPLGHRHWPYRRQLTVNK